jgi:hypothetical protein
LWMESLFGVRIESSTFESGSSAADSNKEIKWH